MLQFSSCPGAPDKCGALPSSSFKNRKVERHDARRGLVLFRSDRNTVHMSELGRLLLKLALT